MKKMDIIHEVDTLDVIQEVDTVKKFNPYHDARGRFTTAGSASSFTIRTRAGYNQGMADRSIQRAKEKYSEGQSAKKPKMVDGKDISKTFKYDPKKGGNALDQVAEMQGYNGKGRVVKDVNEFKTAAKESGNILYRTESNEQRINDIKNSDKFKFEGSESEVDNYYDYGSGMMIVSTAKPVKGKFPSEDKQLNAISHAVADLNIVGGINNSKAMVMTLDKSAKIADYDVIEPKFNKLSQSERDRFGNDISAYAASQGYDAAFIYDPYGTDTRGVIYNRSKLVMLDQTFNAKFDFSIHATTNDGIPTF